MALTRGLVKFYRLCTANDFKEISNAGSLTSFPFITSVRTKHYNPKFKWHRGKKFIPVYLPHTKEYERQRINLVTNLGVYPRYWKPRPLTVTSAVDIIEPYKPVLGDGKVSKLSGGLVTDVKAKIADITAMRRIKNYEPHFRPETFLQELQDIYIKAHTTLTKNSAEELSQFATDRANAEMREGIKNKTIRWKFIESLEPPRIVQSRVAEIVVKTNLFAQVTVRFHSKQTLAIYDRFGRLMYGSEILAKDVLEFVVFEKHINNVNGVWRLHGKIIPEWKEADASARTYVIKADEEEDEEADELDNLEEYFETPSKPEYREISQMEQSETKPSS